MTDSWQSILYNGLLEEKKGKTPPVHTGMITKANIHQQQSEIVDTSPNIESNNTTTRNLRPQTKYGISTHRQMAFQSQE